MKRCRSPSPPRARVSLTVASWCLNWNQISAEAGGCFCKLDKDSRAASLIEGGRFDVLLLQQTSLGLLETLKCNGFSLLAEDKGMAVLLASRLQPRVIGSAITGPGFVGAKVRTPFHGDVLLASLSMVNGSGEHAAEQRKLQLGGCVTALSAACNGGGLFTIIAGDTSMRMAERFVLDELRLRDAWVEAGSPRQARFTFDSKTNRFKANTAEYVCRYDRVLFASDLQYNAIATSEFRLLGNAPIAGGFFLSSHYGVSSQIEYDAVGVCMHARSSTGKSPKRVVRSAARMLAELDSSSGEEN